MTTLLKMIPTKHIKPNKRRLSIKTVIGGLALVCILNYFIRLGVCTNKSGIDRIAQDMVNQDMSNQTVDKALIKIRDKDNATCPFKIDSLTTLEGVTISGKDTLQYNYMFLTDGKKYNLPLLQKMIGDKITKDFIGTPSAEIFKKYKVTVIYNYVDSNRTFMFKSIFSPTNSYQPQ